MVVNKPAQCGVADRLAASGGPFFPDRPPGNPRPSLPPGEVVATAQPKDPDDKGYGELAAYGPPPHGAMVGLVALLVATLGEPSRGAAIELAIQGSRGHRST